MRHKTHQAAIELGFARLALLRTFPSRDPRDLLKEMLEKLKQKDWTDHEFEIEEFDTEAGYGLWAETYDALPNPLVDLEALIVWVACCGIGSRSGDDERVMKSVIGRQFSDLLTKARFAVIPP